MRELLATHSIEYQSTLLYLSTVLNGLPDQQKTVGDILQNLFFELGTDGYSVVPTQATRRLEASSASTNDGYILVNVFCMIFCVICAGLASGLTQVRVSFFFFFSHHIISLFPAFPSF
jgi:hypothetical protein